jgi:hypothetical protein
VGASSKTGHGERYSLQPERFSSYLLSRVLHVCSGFLQTFAEMILQPSAEIRMAPVTTQ